MKIRRCLLAASLLSINVGCLNLASNFLIDENTKPIAGNAGAKEKLLPPKECAEICLTIGTELEKGGYLADAAIQYEKVRKLDPKTQVVGRRLAVLYDQLGEERRALTEYDDALKRTPKDADLLNDYGYFHYSRGRWQPAATLHPRRRTRPSGVLQLPLPTSRRRAAQTRGGK